MQALAFAQDEAIHLKHDSIRPEHVLLGLIREGEGVAARVLDSQGVELSKARSTMTLTAPDDAAAAPKQITLAPRTKKVIEHALDEAKMLGHDHIGTEHLLLGLVREGDGKATGVLESLGVSHVKVRQQVIATLKEQSAASTSVPSAKELKGS